jgi:uncharacterized tellurite resistance protein B-like protein
MLDAISRLFTRPDNDDFAPFEPRVAVAALLVHLAAVDGSVKPEERRAVKQALKAHYGLDDGEVARLVAEATRRDAVSVDFYHFTSALSRLDIDERLEIIEMMWQVVFSDSDNHELEDNMVWRIAELIGVSARQRTVLRNKIRRARA